MNIDLQPTATIRKGASERGAALIATLLLSTLLLMAGGALVLTTSLASSRAIDSTAETQAYYGAEAGLQASLAVLRGNVAPDASLAGTKITFKNAVTLNKSNKTGDTSTTPRLSGWLTYSYQNAGVANDWRVPVSANYAPLTGIAYSIVVSDPDNTAAGGTPSRLLIKSTGYGPRGAVKQLEMIVKSSGLDFSIPATLTMRGADDGSAAILGLGNYNLKNYSGQDNANPTAPNLPVLAVTNKDTRIATDAMNAGSSFTNPRLGVLNIDTALNPTTQANANPSSPVVPAPPTVNSVPDFLQTADKARAFVSQLKAIAQGENRVFNNFTGAPGSDETPHITFVEGDASITGGAGLLIVTGNLSIDQDHSFNGLILVLGGGRVTREPGGPSALLGAIVIARFGATGGFQSPYYIVQQDYLQEHPTNVQYDSSKVKTALDLAAAGVTVSGVVEK